MRSTFTRSIRALGLAFLCIAGAREGVMAQGVNVSGSWIFEVTTDAGTGTPTVTLEQVGDSISGHYSSTNLGEADLGGRVQGNQITFAFEIDGLGTPVTVTYQGTIESPTSMRGTLDIAGLAGGTFTARPRPAEPAAPG